MKNLHLLTRIILIFIFTFSLLTLAKAQVTVKIISDKDNSIYSTNPEGSNGLGGELHSGRLGYEGGLTIRRSLLHFDLSSIPAGSTIYSATLILQVRRNKDGGVSLHKLIANWGSSDDVSPPAEGDATWNHAFFPNTKWTTPGGDFETTATASTGNLEEGAPLIIPNLTADVQSWVNNSSTNFGWMLKGTDDNIPYTAKIIYSRNHPVENLRPVLHVTYCNGSVVYIDADGDGYGDAAKSYFAPDCIAPDGYVYDSTDCNDNPANGGAIIHPWACDASNGDGVDNNCDGVIDNGIVEPKLYGTTHDGGSNNVGVIFSFNPSSSTYTKVKDFGGEDGIYPYGSLIQASDGKLYGTTNEGELY
jgi:uncharacterized repeat protein (TIGR03803 family)